MTFRGSVDAIYVAPAAEAPMRPADAVEAIAGRGLEGDRYADGTGTFWAADRPEGQVTLIESEAVAAAADQARSPIAPAETRRNIVTSGVPLNHLVGRRFRVGAAVLEGVELCEPCTHVEKLSGKNLRKPLVHRGGLNAVILTGGRVAVGDSVQPVEQDPS